jgi:hypothetical protein
VEVRHLEDIDSKEVSYVSLPATRKRFLFIKQDMQELVDAFNKSMQVDSDIEKRKEVKNMDPELKKLLDDYFGEEVKLDTEEFEKAKLSDAALNSLKGALNILNKYKADFPADLKDAIGVLAKYSSYGYGYGYPAKKEEKKDEKVEKSGRVLSKDTITKIKNIVKALNDLLPDIDKLEEVKKSDNVIEGKDAIEEFKKALEDGMSEITKKLEESLKDKDQIIEKLSKRIEVVEKEKGIKKGIEGQDDDNNDAPKKKWTSFKY